VNLVMTLLCRNEEDIIGSNLAFHLRQGVDFVIAMDNGSEDNTVDILRGYERDGVLELLHQPEDDYNQSAWTTEMARLAKTKYGADWVINNDADEFWWPLVGNLKAALTLLSREVDVVTASRFNFVPVSDEKGFFFERMVTREVLSLNSLGMPLPTKVCHRADAEVVVEQGNHGVFRPSSPMRAGETRPIEILHFPLRSYHQFEQKIAKGGAAYERNPRDVGKTWRDLYELYKREGLHSYYTDQVYDLARLQAGIASRHLMVDSRLKDFLED
jgi:hypothetical protein